MCRKNLSTRVPSSRRRLFERVDGVVTTGPDASRHEFVHADHQHIFVVRAIEDGDVSGVPARPNECATESRALPRWGSEP